MKLNSEQRKFVKEVLKIPSKEITDLALSYVNLSNFQKEIIEMTEIKKMTEMEICDYYAEKNNKYYDRSTIERAKKEAYEKMYDVWSNNYFISKIMKVA